MLNNNIQLNTIMNIIIPLGGKGERFSKNGYTQPKPLITIFEKCMIDYVLDNISYESDDSFFIIYNKELDKSDFCEYISKRYPYINLIPTDDTKGAVETLKRGIEYISSFVNHHQKCLVLDCDTFYRQDIVSIFRSSNENTVFYTKNADSNPIYSYIEMDADSNIIKIKEKQVTKEKKILHLTV